jgi:hypothetical protein
MTRITTGCPRCGRVELGVEEITLVTSPREGIAWYLFDCAGCAHRVVKPAPGPVVAALSGVHVNTWTVPAEALERELPDAAAPLGVDDVLDGLLWLRGCQDPDEFTTPSSGAAGSRNARPSAA